MLFYINDYPYFVPTWKSRALWENWNLFLEGVD